MPASRRSRHCTNCCAAPASPSNSSTNELSSSTDRPTLAIPTDLRGRRPINLRRADRTAQRVRAIGEFLEESQASSPYATRLPAPGAPALSQAEAVAKDPRKSVRKLLSQVRARPDWR